MSRFALSLFVWAAGALIAGSGCATATPLLDDPALVCVPDLAPDVARADSLERARAGIVPRPSPEILGGLDAVAHRAGRPAGADSVEADVVLAIRVDKRGQVSDIETVRSTDSRFVPGARRAVAASRFTPSEARGRPIAWRCVVPVAFRRN